MNSCRIIALRCAKDDTRFCADPKRQPPNRLTLRVKQIRSSYSSAPREEMERCVPRSFDHLTERAVYDVRFSAGSFSVSRMPCYII